MAKIEEYSSPVTLLRPDREGYAANELLGRRLGPLYNDIAQALRQGGAAAGRGIVNHARVAQLIAELAAPAVSAVRAGGGSGGSLGGSARDRGNEPTRLADAASKLAGLTSALAKSTSPTGPQGVDRFGSAIGKSLAQGGDTNLRPDLNIMTSRQFPESVAKFQAYNTREAIPGQYIGPPEYDTSGDYGGTGGPYPDWGVSATIGTAPAGGKIVWPTTVYGGDSAYPRYTRDTPREDIMRGPDPDSVYGIFSRIYGFNDYGGGSEANVTAPTNATAPSEMDYIGR